MTFVKLALLSVTFLAVVVKADCKLKNPIYVGSDNLLTHQITLTDFTFSKPVSIPYFEDGAVWKPDSLKTIEIYNIKRGYGCINQDTPFLGVTLVGAKWINEYDKYIWNSTFGFFRKYDYDFPISGGSTQGSDGTITYETIINDKSIPNTASIQLKARYITSIQVSGPKWERLSESAWTWDQKTMPIVCIENATLADIYPVPYP